MSTSDTVAPTLVSAVNQTATSMLVTLSEPISNIGAGTFTLPDGTTSTVNLVATTVATQYTVAIPVGLLAGKTGTESIIGIQDFATNLVSPNPVTFNATKGMPDDIKPSIVSVTQTGAKEFTVQFSAELQTTVADLKTQTTLTNQSGAVAVAVTTVEKSTTDATKYIYTTDKVLDTATTISFANPLTNVSGTATTTTLTKIVTFTKDTVAPAVTSSAIEKDSTTGFEYLVLTFDKNVELGAVATANCSTGSAYAKNYITTAFTSVAPGASNVAYKDVTASKKVVRVTLDSLLGASDVENAVYTAKVTLAGITSEALVAPAVVTASFTRTNDTPGSSGAALTVTSITRSATDNNKIDVVYSRDVDGATATTASNYVVQGAVVESVTLTDTTHAVINLKADSNPNTGLVNVSIANVLTYDKARTVDATTQAVGLVENVRPTIKTAALTDLNTITLTFTEDVKGIKATDFDVYIGGNLVDITKVSNSIVAGKTVTITLVDALTTAQLASEIVVKPETTIGVAITDNATPTNALNFTSITVTK